MAAVDRHTKPVSVHAPSRPSIVRTGTRFSAMVASPLCAVPSLPNLYEGRCAPCSHYLAYTPLGDNTERDSWLQNLVILQNATDRGVHVFNLLIRLGLGTLQMLDHRGAVVAATPELDDIHEDVVHSPTALDASR